MADGLAILLSSVSRAALGGPLDDASGFIFYREIHGFLSDALRNYGVNLFERFVSWAGVAAVTLLTLWTLIQGYRIMTGRSRDSMTVFVIEMTKAVIIVSIATCASLGAGDLHEWVSYDLGNLINRLGTGKSTDLFESVDRSLGYMQLAFGVIDGIQVGESRELQNLKDMNMVMVFVGSGIPAIVTGALLLLYEIMAALTLGFAPLFVLCLLFPQTRHLFWGWLYYLLGTLFSLAVLSVMAALAMDMICAVAAAFWVGKFTGANPEGVNSLALQQGGLGLLLTALIVSAPRIAAQFFKGMLADFTPFSAFGSGAAVRSTGSSQARTYVPPHTSRSEYLHAPTPTYAHRVSMPAQAQADVVKQVADKQSFLERYPNATASLGEPAGRGDSLPDPALRTASTVPAGFQSDQSNRRLDKTEIQVISESSWTESRAEIVKGMIAKDLNAIGDMIRRSGDVELADRFANLKIGVDFDDWKIKYSGTQAENGYGQAYFDSGRVVLNGARVESALSMHDRVEHTVHELRHLMIENNKLITSSSGTPLDPIEKNAQEFTEEFMKKYWRPEYEFYKF